MAQTPLVIVGLPGGPASALAQALGGAQQLGAEDKEGGEGWAARAAAAWSAHFEAEPSARALLVYEAPWRHLRRSIEAQADPAKPLERQARAVLQRWHGFHAALQRMARSLDQRAMLLNIGAPLPAEALLTRIEQKFGLRLGWVHAAAAPAAPESDALYCQLVGALLPDCLDLYAGMEARAELLGRTPDFDLGGPARRGALVPETLAALLRHARIEAKLADAERLQGENRLYLLQLEQVQQELERYFELERDTAERLKEAEARLAAHAAPLHTKLARGAGALRGSAAALIASTGRRILLSDRRRAKQALRAIRESGLFDPAWYLAAYPDVAQSGADPLEHYVQHGVAEGRNPGAGFDTRWYVEAYPDVAAGGMNPLLHYVQFGRGEGRLPLPPPQGEPDERPARERRRPAGARRERRAGR